MFGALPQGNINTSSEPCDVALIPDICQSLHHLIINACKERVSPSKRINFRKCSKGPFPPPHFWKIMLQFYIMDIFANMQGRMRAR